MNVLSQFFTQYQESFLLLLPSLILILTAISLIMISLFIKNFSITHALSIGLLASVASLILSFLYSGIYTTQLNNIFTNNIMIQLSEKGILVFLAIYLGMMKSNLVKQNWISPEYVIILLIATASGLFLIRVTNILYMYGFVELMAISLYILASMNKDNPYSIEAGMKYFILGGAISAIMLYGMSIFYGFHPNFDGTFLASSLNGLNISPMFLIGTSLILISLLFKISAVPFHAWSPDVYQGIPRIVTCYFMIIVKFILVIFTARFCYELLQYSEKIQLILHFIGIASIVIGSLGALYQDNLKRLLAFGSISHVGFLVLMISNGSDASQGLLVYMFSYALMNFGFFAFLFSMQNQENNLNNIENLSGIAKIYPFKSLCLLIILFSMAGIPPMIGFFAKLTVIYTLIENNHVLVAILAIVASVVSAFYYLRIIKYMYFEEATDETCSLSSTNDTSIIFFALVNLFGFMLLFL